MQVDPLVEVKSLGGLVTEGYGSSAPTLAGDSRLAETEVDVVHAQFGQLLAANSRV
jgi:hypothetical protein